MRFILGMLFTALVCLAADKSTITIYQDGYAVVREARTLNLTTGDNQVTIGDLPKNVMGESFQLGGRGLALRQFEFKGPTQPHYNLEQMLDEARGKEVGFRIDSVSMARGVLLQADNQGGNVYIKTADGTIKLFPRTQLRDWVFYQPELKAERAQSEVACVISTEAQGEQAAGIAYEAAGFQWDARYRLLLDEDSSGILEGWASVLNRSGKKYDNAELVLVEGRLGRYRNLSLDNRLDGGQVANIIAKQPGFKVDPDGGLHARGGRDTEAKYQVDGLADSAPYSSSKRLVNSSGLNVEDIEILTGGDVSSGGYQSALIRVSSDEGRTYASESHLDLTLYSLPYPAVLPDSAQTEVVLLDASKVKAYQVYSFFGLDRNQPASVTLQLLNKEQEGLGLALPAAELQLFRKTKDGLEQFVGSHRLEKTAAGDTVRVNLGGDPEIQCKSVTTKADSEGRTRAIEFEHTLKSTKSDTVAVSCMVRFNGEITIQEPKEPPFEMKTNRRNEKIPQDDLHFTMILPPNEEVKAAFAVKVKLPK